MLCYLQTITITDAKFHIIDLLRMTKQSLKIILINSCAKKSQKIKFEFFEANLKFHLFLSESNKRKKLKKNFLVIINNNQESF